MSNLVYRVSNDEIEQRQKDYTDLDIVTFAEKYRGGLFKTTNIEYYSNTYGIQMNFCDNPFCKNYGKPQVKYNNVKNKPSRYKLQGVMDYYKTLICNGVYADNENGIVLNSTTSPLSNWSIAEEIKRLIDINTVIAIEPEYIFHKDNCLNTKLNPFDNRGDFYARGKSSSNSQKYQCKVCKKINNVLPTQRECFTYNQNKNDILPIFTRLLLNKTPVRRTCEILDISPQTYYNKLEWLYRKCLEFLERYEGEALKEKEFKSLWLNTDKLVYHLNNIRRKGCGGKEYGHTEKLVFPTGVIATSDMFSRYIFRVDVAFEWQVTVKDIERDIEILKENHLYNFTQRNAKYRYSFYDLSKKEPTADTVEDDKIDITKLLNRKDYLNGFHFNATYTAIAHYWALKQNINVQRLYYVSDKDSSLMIALMRVYKDEIENNTMDCFLCQVDKKMSKKEAYVSSNMAKNELQEWKDTHFFEGNLKETAIKKLAEDLSYHSLYKYVDFNGKSYPIHANNPIEHPYPFKDEGARYVDCVTDLSYLSNDELADLLYNVNSRSINTFFNQIRRRLSILERPLVSSRGEGKSYIYANFNPMYAQYSLTILRTFLNFCETYKYKGENVTPAQRLGITNKKFKIEDIIYFV